MSLLHSNVGLYLTAVPVLVHGLEVIFPMAARFLANLVLPIFGFQLPTDSAAYLTLEDQVKMLEGAISAAPSEKWRTAADYIFVLTFEQRQGSAGFWATLIGSIYALSLPFAERHPIHFLLMALDVFMIIGNLSHATGFGLLGYNPMVTSSGRNLGIVFAPFWLLNFYFNYMAFQGSKEAAAKSD